MMKSLIGATLLFLSQCFNAFAGDEDARYREALLRELNNRTLAGQVVTALADVHRGTPQGDFWQAYSLLEDRQWPLYARQAELHGLEAGGWLLSLKAWASIVFAQLLPETFIAKLAEATQHYLAELQAIAPPTKDAQFWNHVIAQERAQSIALQYAMGENYVRAQAEIANFFVNERLSPTSD